MRKKLLAFLLTSFLFTITFCSKTTSIDEELLPPSDLNICQVGNNKINLTWQSNSNKETKFFIDRKEGEFAWWIDYGQVEKNITVFSDYISLTSDTVYSYRVRAFDGNDYSEYSYTIGWFSDSSVPTNLILTQITQDSIKLTWDDNSIGEEGFIIDKKIGSANWQESYKIVEHNVTDFTDFNITIYDTCSYRVSAYCGNSTSNFIESDIKTLEAPTNLQIEKLDSTTIKLTWQDKSLVEQGYKIDRKINNNQWTNEIDSVGSDVNEWTDYYIPINQGIVYYRVYAYCGNYISNKIEKLYCYDQSIVELSLFIVEYLGNISTLYWITESETLNFGWNVYRNTTDDFSSSTKVNGILIPGYGTTSVAHEYFYEDTGLVGENIETGDIFYYWIECRNDNNMFSVFGPIELIIPG